MKGRRKSGQYRVLGTVKKWIPVLPYAYNLSVGAAAPLDMLKQGGATPRMKLTSPTIPNWIYHMQISIDDARHLVERVMIAHGLKQEQAAIIAEHIIDCELRGLGYGGLARVISIAERLL